MKVFIIAVIVLVISCQILTLRKQSKVMKLQDKILDEKKKQMGSEIGKQLDDAMWGGDSKGPYWK